MPLTSGWIAILSLLASPGDAGSPQSERDPSRARRASVSGVVYDSLARNGPVSDAEIWLDGDTSYLARTDANGAWRIDDLRPGRYTATFFHATLDSLGFSAPPRYIDVPDSGSVAVTLATPSPSTVHRGLCPAPQPPTTGVLIGRVHDAHGATPVRDAEVTASWTEWAFGDRGLARRQRRAAVTGDATGVYRLCGVPNDIALVIRAQASGFTTGPVEVHLQGSAFAVRGLRVGLLDSAATFADLPEVDSLTGEPVLHSPQGGTAAVVGVVRTTDGRRVPDARAMLLGFTVASTTDSAGSFRLGELPGGTQTVEVRALGYSPVRTAVDLRAGATDTVRVTLDRAAPVLETLKIIGAPPSAADWTGFSDRLRTGQGHYLSRDEIARRHAYNFGDLLMGIPGVRVVQQNNSTFVSFPRATGQGGKFAGMTCLPTYYVDGSPVVGGDPTDFLRTNDIYGIEVYVSLASAPPRYQGMEGGCGVILVWTKRASRR